jgi:transposase
MHSRYVRHLADAVLGDRPVRIDLSVRRLYCENSACPKVTFAEQVPGLTVRYQRRTPLLQHLVEAVGVVLAGRGGARMLSILNISLSRCTVLAQLMRVPLPPLVIARVLGVDDFALYADTYGTLLVDADTRLPLTLWEGRDAEQLSRWLRGHPGVEIACRDGSLTYRQGIADGAQRPSRSVTASICGRACPGAFRKSPPLTAAACPTLFLPPRQPSPSSRTSRRRNPSRRTLRPPGMPDGSSRQYTR